MSMASIQYHEKTVREFFRQQERDHPSHYAAVCEYTPILSGRKWKQIREKEVPLTPALSVALGIDSGDDEDYSEE